MRTKASFAVFVLVLSCFATALADRVDLEKGFDANVIVEESDDLHTVIRFEVGAFDKSAVTTDRGTYYKVSCNYEALLTDRGEPELPQLLRNIIIPDDKEMEIRVLSSQYRDFEGVPVAPSKGLLPRSVDPDTIPYTFGPVYDSDTWYPSQLAKITGPFIMRDFRGTTIKLNAFQYNPKIRALRVYTSVTVEVRVVGPSRVNVLERRKELRERVRVFEEIYRNQFINYSFFQTKVDYLGESGDMLIITSDSFHDYVMPFVEWKRQKGIKTTIVDVSAVGNDTTSIKTFVQAFYDSTDLTYLLLVGDVDSVATPYAACPVCTAWAGPADPAYSLAEGDDNYPDIFVGRFSAEEASHVQTQVERSIEYERDHPGSGWFDKGTCVASATEADIPKARLIAQLLTDFTYSQVDTMFEPDATGPWLAWALNQGRSIVSYAGHGLADMWVFGDDPYRFEFTSTDVANLTNSNKLPFIYSTACLVGAMDGTVDPCFAEHWLRATDAGQPAGAIATYMSSTPSYYANNEGMADLLVNGGMSTVGALSFNSLLGHPNFKTQIIFGDPSLQLCTDVPQQLIVDHSGELDVGQTEYEVEVDGVEGALCALYNDGILYGSAYTDFFGVATIPIEVLLPEDDCLTLTVTAFNKATYTDQLAIPNFPPHNFHVESWTDNSVTLAWMPKEAWTSKGYNIYRDTLSGQPGVKINPRLIHQSKDFYVNLGLEYGRTYYYTITNVDTNYQESERSPEVRITLGQPSAPTGLTADTVGCDIRLDWLPNPEEDSVTQYRVYRKAPEDDAFILSDSTTDTTYVDTSITRVGVHKHAVTAVDDLGFESHLSAPTTVEFTVEVEAPDSLWVESWFDRTVTLTWAASGGAAGYNLYRTISGPFGDPPINSTPITESTYQDTGLTEGTVYYYVASTITDLANCGVETEMSSNPLGFLAGRPQTPAGLQADVNDSCEIALSWWSNLDADIAKYRIYYKIDHPDSLFVVKDSVLAPETTFVDTSVDFGVHKYRLTAVDQLGLESYASAAVSVGLETPLIPRNFRILDWFGTAVTLKWYPYGTEDGFNIYRSIIPGQFSPPPINDIPITGSTYQDTGLIEGVTYYYVATSIGDCGMESEFSNQVEFLAGKPQTPAGLQAEVNDSCDIVLSWWSNPDEDILKYRIYHKADTSGSSFQPKDSVFAPETTYVDVTVNDGLEHCYAIVAIDSLGLESNMFGQACASLGVGTPQVISVVSYDGASVTVRAWTPLFPDLVGCNFYRSLVSHDYEGLEPINDILLVPDAAGWVEYADTSISQGTTYYYTATNVSECGMETERCPWVWEESGGWWLEDSIYTYVAGDANNDSIVGVGDIVFLTNYIYHGGPEPPVMEAADANGDCDVDEEDITYLVNYLYQSGPPPVYECSESKEGLSVPLGEVKLPASID